MKMYLKPFLLIFAFNFYFSVNVNAQLTTIQNIAPKSFTDVKHIEGKGYFTFFRNKKNKQGKVNYTFQLYDLDLKLITEKDLYLNKKSEGGNAVYNGNSFLISFFNQSTREISLIAIDSDGNLTDQLTIPNVSALQGGIAYSKFPIINSAGSEGFYIISPISGSKGGFQIIKTDNTLKKIWQQKIISDKITTVIKSEATLNRIVLLLEKREKKNSKVNSPSISVFDGNTGNNIYEYELSNASDVHLPSSFLIEEDGSLVTGGIYFSGPKLKIHNSTGIFFLKLASNGNQILYSKKKWKGEIKNYLKKYTETTNPKVIFHSIIKTNGNYQLLGEAFKKTLNGVDLVTIVLTTMAGQPSNVNNSDFSILDFVLFNIDSQTGTLKSIELIEKEKRDYYIPFIGGGLGLAYYMKNKGAFSFLFIDENNERKQVIYYENIDSNKKPYLSTATIEDEENIKIEKLDIFIPTNQKRIYLNSKKGQLMGYFFHKESKSLNMWIEKFK